MGNLLAVVVHVANIHGTKSGILVARDAFKKYLSIGTASYITSKYVLNVLPCFFTPSPDPHLEDHFLGKRIRTNRQPIANTRYLDLSLLRHKGTRVCLCS